MNARVQTPVPAQTLPGDKIEQGALRLRSVEPAEWDEIAVQFRDVLHEQTQCFNALRWEPHQLERIAFYQGGELVSAAVVLLLKAPVFRGGIAVIKWGPLWRPTNAGGTPKVLKQAVEALKHHYAKDRGYFLTFFPRADPEVSETEVEVFEQCSMVPGEELSSPDRYFVNTAIPLDALRASLTQKWRYNLKKAEKLGLSARFVTGLEGVETFMTLYRSMLDRKAFHDTSAIDTLEALMDADEPSLRPKILIVEHDGKPIAGGVVDVSGERAVYLYGATNDKALPLKAGYVMHWAIATYLVNDPRVRWYDLGGADKDCNLHQFKRGFVGKSGVITITPRYYHYGATIQAKLMGYGLFFARRKKGELARFLHDLRNKRLPGSWRRNR